MPFDRELFINQINDFLAKKEEPRILIFQNLDFDKCFDTWELEDIKKINFNKDFNADPDNDRPPTLINIFHSIRTENSLPTIEFRNCMFTIPHKLSHWTRNDGTLSVKFEYTVFQQNIEIDRFFSDRGVIQFENCLFLDSINCDQSSAKEIKFSQCYISKMSLKNTSIDCLVFERNIFEGHMLDVQAPSFKGRTVFLDNLNSDGTGLSLWHTLINPYSVEGFFSIGNTGSSGAIQSQIYHAWQKTSLTIEQHFKSMRDKLNKPKDLLFQQFNLKSLVINDKPANDGKTRLEFKGDLSSSTFQDMDFSGSSTIFRNCKLKYQNFPSTCLEDATFLDCQWLEAKTTIRSINTDLIKTYLYTVCFLKNYYIKQKNYEIAEDFYARELDLKILDAETSKINKGLLKLYRVFGYGNDPETIFIWICWVLVIGMLLYVFCDYWVWQGDVKLGLLVLKALTQMTQMLSLKDVTLIGNEKEHWVWITSLISNVLRFILIPLIGLFLWSIRRRYKL